jgi:large subunit ribosomal protein L22
MLVKAQVRHQRISPVKLRQVTELIHNKGVLEAGAILRAMQKRPKEFLIKLLNQAVANAKVKGFKPEQLYIAKIVCNSGPSWKRFKAAAFGRASPILRRTSHIRLELDLKA